MTRAMYLMTVIHNRMVLLTKVKAKLMIMKAIIVTVTMANSHILVIMWIKIGHL